MNSANAYDTVHNNRFIYPEADDGGLSPVESLSESPAAAYLNRSHGKTMKAYLGFVPLAVVLIPFLIAAIRHALFYKGCMDGLGYVLVAMGAFMVGGVLNVAYLLFVAVTHRSHFLFEERWRRMVAKSAFIGSLLLLIVQLVVVASIVWKKLTMD